MTESVKKWGNRYYKPTPKKWRRLGDALLGVSTMITGYAIADELKWVALTALLIGSVGKFLTNFFAGEDKPKSTEEG